MNCDIATCWISNVATFEKVRENSTKKKVWEKNIRYVREKIYGKKSKGKSHVTSGDITSGQACAVVRSSGSSTNTTWKPLIYYSLKINSYN
jgi:hypothetical protein